MNELKETKEALEFLTELFFIAEEAWEDKKINLNDFLNPRVFSIARVAEQGVKGSKEILNELAEASDVGIFSLIQDVTDEFPFKTDEAKRGIPALIIGGVFLTTGIKRLVPKQIDELVQKVDTSGNRRVIRQYIKKRTA